MAKRAIKDISNDEFNAAYANPSYRRVMRSVISKFGRSIHEDDVVSIEQYALLMTLRCHDDLKQLFTTSLFRFTTWECLRVINRERNHRLRFVSLDDAFCRAAPERPEGLELIGENLKFLSREQRELVTDYHLGGKTIGEIAEDHGWSKECARQRVERATGRLRELCTV